MPGDETTSVHVLQIGVVVTLGVDELAVLIESQRPGHQRHDLAHPVIRRPDDSGPATEPMHVDPVLSLIHI